VALEPLFEDEHVVALAKPPGRIVIPGRGAPERSLHEEAQERFGELWVVHRLDRGTSGLLLFARSAEAHRALNLAFDRREVEKRYLAVVSGALPDEVRIAVALASARRGRMRPAREGDPHGKPAATRFRVLERLRRPEATALVECLPETGRTHQIRVHLAHYGPREPIREAGGRVILDRTPLHAWRLALRHPVRGTLLELEATLPDDMESLLRWARDA
jgi:tRNA pseudouridine32 synthase/23S rRNA pseudouridine746 synthase